MPKVKRIKGELFWSKRGIFLRRPEMPSARFAPAIGIHATVSVQGLPDKFVVIDFLDYAKKLVSIKVPRADFLSLQKFKKAVEGTGYEFPRDAEAGKLLHEFIINRAPRERWHLVDRSGWHENQFVLLNLPAKKDGVSLRLETDKPQYCAVFEKRGSLTGWQQQVAEHALCSHRMLFAICLAFAAPLMHFATVEPGGFHLFGKTTKGKSICLIVASSVAGPGTRDELPNWDVTDGGLEEAAAGHNHSLLFLDETGHLRTDATASIAKKLRAHAFKLAGGRGRLRSSLWGHKLGARELKWRLLFLSTGELALSEIAAAEDIERLKGKEVRLIDVPGTNGEALGVYEKLPPDFSSLEEALVGITKACADNCGFAFEAYVARLGENLEGLEGLVASRMSRFMAEAKVSDDAWERRFAQRFALAFAAGSIAADFGIVPWKVGAIGDAVRFCYWTARQAIPDVDQLRHRGLQTLRQKLGDKTITLELKRAGHNVSWTPDDAKKAQVFRRSEATGTQFIVAPATFDHWLGSRLQSELVLRYLEAKGLLVKSNRGIRTTQILIEGLSGRAYYYCISDQIFSRV